MADWQSACGSLVLVKDLSNRFHKEAFASAMPATPAAGYARLRGELRVTMQLLDKIHE